MIVVSLRLVFRATVSSSALRRFPRQVKNLLPHFSTGPLRNDPSTRREVCGDVAAGAIGAINKRQDIEPAFYFVTHFRCADEVIA
jgi:hypothetical protein